MRPRNYLLFSDLSAQQATSLLARAEQHRAGRLSAHGSLAGKVLVMLFECNSTRTRVSFEAGMAQLGGHAIFLAMQDAQLARGESISDTARALSTMADAVMLRTHLHADQVEFASGSSVPVINGLSEVQHPCQTLADVLTYEQLRGPIANATIAWIGDASNVCNSLIDAACLFGFKVRVAAPDGYQPAGQAAQAGANALEVMTDPLAAAQDADCVMTDVWASMNDEDQAGQRRDDLADYQVDAKVMAAAKPDAIFMHCLPAHRGEEVTSEVIDSSASAVWQEAENRLHVQKALLEMLIGSKEDKGS